MTRMSIAFALLLFLLLPIGYAQQNLPRVDWKKIDQTVGPAQPPSTPAVSTRLQKAYEDYVVFALQQRTAAFAWHMAASRMIFWMVFGLVVVGVVFSAFQFWRSKAFDTQEVDISLQGLKVRSQFLGVVTLAISVAFFYLYLKTVYPLFDVDQQPKASASVK